MGKQWIGDCLDLFFWRGIIFELLENREDLPQVHRWFQWGRLSNVQSLLILQHFVYDSS